MAMNFRSCSHEQEDEAAAREVAQDRGRREFSASPPTRFQLVSPIADLRAMETVMWF